MLGCCWDFSDLFGFILAHSRQVSSTGQGTIVSWISHFVLSALQKGLSVSDSVIKIPRKNSDWAGLGHLLPSPGWSLYKKVTAPACWSWGGKQFPKEGKGPGQGISGRSLSRCLFILVLCTAFCVLPKMWFSGWSIHSFCYILKVQDLK